MSGQFGVSVNVFVDAKQRGKLSVSERLRRLLREGRNREQNPRRQEPDKTNLHIPFIAEI